MRKWTALLAILGSVIVFAACSSAAAEPPAKTTREAEAAQTEPAVTEPAETKAESYTAGPDVDVLIAPNNLAFNQFSDMLSHSDENRGKVVQMIGLFTAYYLESSDYMYIACEIPAPSSCCMPGIEFELAADAVYPDDYPKTGTVITVKGEFDTYERDGETFGILRNAVIE